MSQYKHVLYATALTNGTKDIAKKAQGIAHALGAQFSLLHIVPEFAGYYSYAYMCPKELKHENSMLTQAKEDMNALASSLGIEESACHVQTGLPKEDILRFAHQHHIDLIVINGHQHTWVGMLGSTATMVTNKAHCDVLVLSSDRT